MTHASDLPITVGEAVAGDLQGLLELYGYLHPKDPVLKVDQRVEQLWQTIQDDPNLHYVIARCEDQVVSTCTLTIIPNLTRGARPYGVIENVITHPEYRRRGIGASVLHHALQIAWERNCFKVMLIAGRRDEGVLRFYEQVGFGRGENAGFIVLAPPK